MGTATPESAAPLTCFAPLAKAADQSRVQFEDLVSLDDCSALLETTGVRLRHTNHLTINLASMILLHDSPPVPPLTHADEPIHIALQHAGLSAWAGSGTMITLANLVGFRSESAAPLLAQIAGRVGDAMRRAAAGRYTEQRNQIVRTGSAGMI